MCFLFDSIVHTQRIHNTTECFGLIYASRPHLEFDAVTMISSSSMHEDVKTHKEGDQLDDENCEGEKCLMRRTLAAHLNYIYTQYKPRN
nr:phytosulfokines 3 [Arachis hypogaea]